jgi:hypothetical protein
MKSEKPGAGSDNVECFPAEPDATSAYEGLLSSENVKEEVHNGVTDQTCKRSEMTACNEEVPSIDWVTGDLAWAQFPRYPFWPCMITLDPQEKTFTKTSGK